MTGSPINLTDRKNPSNLNYHMSVKKSQAILKYLACENIRFSSRNVPSGEERLQISDRNSILMTQINVYIMNPVVMGFQI